MRSDRYANMRRGIHQTFYDHAYYADNMRSGVLRGYAGMRSDALRGYASIRSDVYADMRICDQTFYADIRSDVCV